VHAAELPALYVPEAHVEHCVEPAAANWPTPQVEMTPYGHAEPAGHCELQFGAPLPQ
jgi:hypothetical protein